MKDYQTVRQQLKQARHEYLKEKNQETIVKIQEKEKVHERVLRVEEGIVDQRRFKRKINNLLSRIESKKSQSKEETLDDSLTVDIAHFKSKLMKPIKEKVYNRKIKQNEEFLKSLTDRTKKYSTKETILKVTRHKYHPPSKLVVDSEKHVRDFMGLSSNLLDPLILSRPKESPKDYQLRITESPQLKNNKSFQKYYSGGPQENENELFQVLIY